MNRSFLEDATLEGADLLSAGLQMLTLYRAFLFNPGAPLQKDCLCHGACSRLSLSGTIHCARVASVCRDLSSFSSEAVGSKNDCQRRIAFARVSVRCVSPACTSTLHYGQPFYILQAKNVWFALYGEGDFVVRWYSVPSTISLIEVIAMDPARLLIHWGEQLFSALISFQLWQPFLHFAWWLGAILLIADQELHPANRFLAVSALFVPILVTALTWLSPRFLVLSGLSSGDHCLLVGADIRLAISSSHTSPGFGVSRDFFGSAYFKSMRLLNGCNYHHAPNRSA